MKLREAITLEEGISSVLFHAVTLDKARWILKNKKLKADKRNAVSFSRSRTNTFMHNMGSDMEGHDGVIVVIEFDGQSLAHNQRGRPIDSFAPSRGDFDYDSYSRDPDFDYMEDRIILKNTREMDFKPNAIRSISFIENDGYDIRQAKAMYDSISGVPKFIYSSIRDFQQRKVKHSFDVGVVIGGKTIDDPEEFADFIDSLLMGYSISPSQSDISNFNTAFKKWKDVPEVKNAIKEILSVYKIERGVSIRNSGDILRMSDQL